MKSERDKAKKICSLLEKSIQLMNDVNLEELHEHTLVMLYNATANHPDFVRAFGGKVKALLETKGTL